MKRTKKGFFENLLKMFRAQETHGMNLNLVDNFQTVIINKSTVSFCKIGTMFHALLDDIKSRRKALLMGIEMEDVVKIPDILVDEPDNNSLGFYFSKIPQNNLQGYEKLLVGIVFGHEAFKGKFGTVEGGKLVLNQPRCYKFLQDIQSLWAALGTLLHICTSGPYRGTEYATTCIRNTANGNSRNVKVILGRLCLVSGYNKTSFATQELKVNYRFIPKCAWPTCIIDFVVFRPFEHCIAKALGIQDFGDRFLARLFPGLEFPTTSTDISKALCQDTSRFLGSKIGLKDWRQITATFSRAHKDPYAVQIRGVDPDNQIRGHNNQTSNENYGITPEDPTGIRFETLKSHLQTAHWWYHLVGIKSGDLSPVDYTANSDDILKKLDQVIEKLDNAEAHIKKLEGHIEGLETRFQTTVTTTVLQDPGVLEPTKKQVRPDNPEFKALRFGRFGTPMVLLLIQKWA
ncbi:hypothetical protein BJ322DRAFT_1023881 [Thelephora terrestris]|nr:hypothetical protein BJ322DRAFT_1023881 [Thelephora terrestris]